MLATLSFGNPDSWLSVFYSTSRRTVASYRSAAEGSPNHYRRAIRAMASISTKAPLGSSFAAKQDLAGTRPPPKNAL